ncbi:MAG: hypothetical protein U1E65_13820 [Myxococcota bacterium]
MFVAQSTLEAWLDSGKAEYDGQVVTLKRHAKRYLLEPAVRVVRVVDGASDATLVGRVIPERRIGELGGELMGDSMVFGNIAFEVKGGYIAEIEPGEGG